MSNFWRIRFATSNVIDLPVTAGDFAVNHLWRIEYKTVTGKLTLYKDGVLQNTSSSTLTSNMVFNQVGDSGGTSTANSANIDYMQLVQDGINGTSSVIKYDF